MNAKLSNDPTQPDYPELDDYEEISRWIYEATRLEAKWSKRPIVPEAWEARDDKFRTQFVDIITKYMSMDKLPTPAEAHESWNQAYYKMGWKYGEVRDTEAKTHPDLVPFDDLPQPEKDKDAIFLAFVWLAKQATQSLSALMIRERQNWAALIEKKYRQLPHDKIKDPEFVAEWLHTFVELQLSASSKDKGQS